MIDLLRSRRSVRKYTKQSVDDKSLGIILEAALRSPSSRGINPWEFVVVDDKELLLRLSASKAHGSQFLKDAALGIVVCADSTKSDVWIEDCSIASILVQMTAQSLGFGSCWIQIRQRKHTDSETSEAYIQGLLGLPERLNVLSIISIGRPDETPAPIAASALDYSKMRHNKYTSVFQKK